MHEIHPAGIPAQIIRINLAKSIGVKPLVQLFGGPVHFLFLSGNPALRIQ
jgi:hypothetical protein